MISQKWVLTLSSKTARSAPLHCSDDNRAAVRPTSKAIPTRYTAGEMAVLHEIVYKITSDGRSLWSFCMKLRWFLTRQVRRHHRCCCCCCCCCCPIVLLRNVLTSDGRVCRQNDISLMLCDLLHHGARGE